MDTTITAGGTYGAACRTCHNPAGAGSISGEYRQHQGLNGVGDTTCYECHNYNAAIQTIVTDEVRDDTCESCHNATVMPGKEMHATTAPYVAGVEWTSRHSHARYVRERSVSHPHHARPARAAREQQQRQSEWLHDDRLPRRRPSKVSSRHRAVAATAAAATRPTPTALSST